MIKEQGHSLLEIISACRNAEAWVIEHNIPHFKSIDEAKKILIKVNFDYLFSIVINTPILPIWLLNALNLLTEQTLSVPKLSFPTIFKMSICNVRI